MPYIWSIPSRSHPFNCLPTSAKASVRMYSVSSTAASTGLPQRLCGLPVTILRHLSFSSSRASKPLENSKKLSKWAESEDFSLLKPWISAGFKSPRNGRPSSGCPPI